MYTPAHFDERNPATLHALLRAHPLGTWVRHTPAGLVADHIPFLLDASRGPHGTLRGHVARANPVWREALDASPSLVVFQGPQAYVTPSWYPVKREHGKVVPTWNYAVVHAQGTARAIDGDAAWLRDFLHDLTRTHEAGRTAPWAMSDAPADYLEQMLKGIVGVEISLTSLSGKWKVHQNHPEGNRRGVIDGLRAQADDASRAMAGLVEQRLPTP